MKKWYQEAIIYQIYPKTFKDGNNDGIGDLRGIIEKISYLKELGINAIWLSPIYASPMDDNGYDISDYQAINPLFGSMTDFKELVEKLHQANIKLIMDLVINHTSSLHPWFIEASKNIKSKYHSYYFFQEKPNNWTSFFSGSAWSYNDETNEYYLHLFNKTQPDLNLANKEVRVELKNIMRFWLDLGVDGFRCDVINLISKKEGLPDGNPNSELVGIEHYANGERLDEYLKEFYDDVFSHYDCFTIGECGIQSLKETLNLTNHKLDMIFNFNHFALDGLNSKWNLKPFKFSEFKASFYSLQQAYNKYGLWNNLVLENHDQPRIATRYANQSYLYESLSMLASYVYLKQGTPFIYQGQELGMTNYPFKDINEFQDVEAINYYNDHKNKIKEEDLMYSLKMVARDNARTVMQWDDDFQASFSKIKTNLLINPNYKTINVKKEQENKKSLFSFYQQLIRLKKTYLSLIYGTYVEYDLDNDDYFIFKREYQNEIIYVVGSNKDKPQTIEVPFTNGVLLLNNLDEDLDYYLPYQVKVYIKQKAN